MYTQITDVKNFKERIESILKELKFNGVDLIVKLRRIFSQINDQIETIKENAETLNVFKLNQVVNDNTSEKYSSDDSIRKGVKKEINLTKKQGEDVSLEEVTTVKETYLSKVVNSKVSVNTAVNSLGQEVVTYKDSTDKICTKTVDVDKKTVELSGEVTFKLGSDTATKTFTDDLGVLTKKITFDEIAKLYVSKTDFNNYKTATDNKIIALEERLSKLETPTP